VPEEIFFLFQKYRRAETTQSQEGTELGLFIAKELVEAHGGRTEVKVALTRQPAAPCSCRRLQSDRERLASIRLSSHCLMPRRENLHEVGAAQPMGKRSPTMLICRTRNQDEELVSHCVLLSASTALSPSIWPRRWCSINPTGARRHSPDH
jgi:hypothetical protein